MTGEATYGDEAHDPQQQLIETITNAVFDEDYDFVVDVAGSQTVLRPFELAEYMNVKRQNSEDPVEQRRWREALQGYLTSLGGQQFPAEEVESINAVVRSMDFDLITSNEEVADEPELAENAEASYEADDWEASEFHLTLDPAIIDDIRSKPIFQKAERYIQTLEEGPTDDPLYNASNLINRYVSGELQVTMLQVLDWYVFTRAKAYAAKELTGPTKDNLYDAVYACDRYGSNQEARLRMRLALDKHIFTQAEAHINDTAKGPTGDCFYDAKHLVQQYASTSKRRDEMLQRLGLQ